MQSALPLRPLSVLLLGAAPTGCGSVQTRGVRTRSRNGRGGGHTRASHALLDKFVKRVAAFDAAVTLNTPFALKVRGSFFDGEGNVDGKRNRLAREGGGSPEPKPCTEATTQVSDFLPAHLLIYGRNHQHTDSYSVLMRQKSATHVYISDHDSVVTTPEPLFIQQHFPPDGVLSALRAAGSAGIWLPEKLRCNVDGAGIDSVGEDTQINKDGDQLVSEIKFYCSSQLLETPDHGLRAVFLIPTSLKRLDLRTERDASLEVDGQLQSELCFVTLTADGGTIKTRDLVVSREIRINSRFGDVLCEGLLDGQVVAETHADGDFLARNIEGPHITVTTDNGDINVWGDCNSDLSQFFTRSGHVHIRYLYNSCYVLVREQGNVNVNVVEGSLTCVVKRGGVFVNVESITADSTIQVAEGEITVTMPARPFFRVNVSASTTNIAPPLLNSGELFLYEDARETFSVGPFIKTKSGGSDQQQQQEIVLNVVANRGTVTLVTHENLQEKNVSNGYDTT